jgi:hypothetical protein
MSKEVPDTSLDYEDMIGYVAEENITPAVTAILGLEDDDEYKPTYLTKSVDPKFPEPWQTCLVSFADKEDYLLFMNKLNRLPYPIKKQLTFEVNESAGILDFLD